MGWLRKVVNVLRPGRLSRDLDREMAFHLAETTDVLVASGLSKEEAGREAARRFGHRPSLRERTRDVNVLGWLESLLADIRYGFRALRASPGFALVTVLSLGLGIGANTAIFSLVNAVILRSLPVTRPEQLVKLGMGDENSDVFTNPLWEEIRARPGMFDGVFAFGEVSLDLASGGRARRVEGEFVSGDFFSTLGVTPARGRLLQAADDHRSCAAVAVVSHGFWQSEFGGGQVVGQRLILNGNPFTIIGASEPGFTGVEIGRSPQIYVPICSEPLINGAPGLLDERSAWWLQLIGRLPEGSSAAKVSARLAAEAPAIYAATLPNWGAEDQKQYRNRTLAVFPAATGLSDVRLRYQAALGVLMAVVVVVLLIACANVANLLLARAAARQREIAMRLAIGASRGRIIRQMLTESLLLSLFGEGLGLGFARWSSALLVGLIGNQGAPVSLDLSLDSRVLSFTLLVAIGTGLVFGIAPAWRSVQLDPQAVLKVGGSASIQTAGSKAAGRALVVGQVALALLLVATAGLLLGTFRSLATLDPGFRSHGVVLAAVDFQSLDLPESERPAVVRQMLDRLRSLPPVQAASASVLTPVSGRHWNSFVLVDGYQPTERMANLVWFNGVTDGYFATLGTGIVAGRDFAPADGGTGPRVAIINESLARKFYGNGNPLGRQFRVQNSDQPGPPVEVVGVVSDAKYRSLRDDVSPTVYVPWTQAEHFGSLIFEVRSDAPTRQISDGILEAAHVALPTASIDLSTLSEQLAGSLARERLLATLSSFFGGLALLLALMGLYGTMAYSVTRRHKEIGVRAALGATRGRLVRLVLDDVGRMVLAGLILGTLATIAATRIVASFLYGRSPADPVTLALAALAVAGMTLGAGAIPAVRAARQDPLAALRAE